MVEQSDWLRSLPAELAQQRDAIEALRAIATSDDRIRVLVVGCSLGRGNFDPLSDIDATIGVRTDAWDAIVAVSQDWLPRLGTLVDHNQLLIPDGKGGQYQHTYAQFANGVELDLVVATLQAQWRRRADWIVLYDPDRLVPSDVTASVTTIDDLRRWGYAVLTRLSAVAKYVSRGALWEGHLCLELARADLWRITAVASAVSDPQYGVTAVFDDPRRPVPAMMTATVAGLEGRALVNAAIAACDVFVNAWPDAMRAIEADPALPPLAAHVRERLAKVST